MKPFSLLLLLSLIHPVTSATLVAFSVFDSLIGVKGAPIGVIYDVLSLGAFILNAPGFLIMVPWLDASFFHATGWKITAAFAVIFLSWAFWTVIACVFLKLILRAYLARIPSPEAAL